MMNRAGERGVSVWSVSCRLVVGENRGGDLEFVWGRVEGEVLEVGSEGVSSRSRRGDEPVASEVEVCREEHEDAGC